jgi:hypothetical protein
MGKKNFVIIGAIVAVVVAGLAYLAFAAAQKRSQQRQVKELVVDTTEKLREVLVPQGSPKPAPDVVAPLEANLKRAKAPRDPLLTDAAESYIISAREIARRRAQVDRLTRQAAASRHALASHMAHAAHRNTAWLNEAITLKKRVEDDHFNLGVELKALDELLYTLPEAEKTLAPHVGRAVLIDDALRDSTRKQTQDEMRRAADDLAGARRLNFR